MAMQYFTSSLSDVFSLKTFPLNEVRQLPCPSPFSLSDLISLILQNSKHESLSSFARFLTDFALFPKIFPALISSI